MRFLTLWVKNRLIVRFVFLLARDQLHVDVFGHECCVGIRTRSVFGGVAKLWQLLATSYALRYNMLRYFVGSHCPESKLD